MITFEKGTELYSAGIFVPAPKIDYPPEAGAMYPCWSNAFQVNGFPSTPYSLKNNFVLPALLGRHTYLNVCKYI